MKFYINSINPKKLEYINNFLLENKIIDKKIIYGDKVCLKNVIDKLDNDKVLQLKEYLTKKKNCYHIEEINDLVTELDASFEHKYYFPKPVIKKFIELVKQVDSSIDERAVLFTIYYLRYGHSFAVNAQFFKVSLETFRRLIWKVIKSTKYIKYDYQNVCFKNRNNYKTYLMDDSNRYFSLIVDGKFAPIKTSDEKYIGRKGKGVIYQFAILAKIGAIVFIDGPVPASLGDPHNFMFSDLSQMPLDDGERLLGDKDYVGEKLLVPFSENANGDGTDLNSTQRSLNYFISKERGLVTRTFRFLKYFKFFQTDWYASIEKHRSSVYLLSFLHNIAIELQNERYLNMMNNS